MNTRNCRTDIIWVGRQVYCDLCNEDYTDLDLQGGFLFGSHAVCPACAPRLLREIYECGEERFIKASCPAGMAFADWVRSIRRGPMGSTITIKSYGPREVRR